ncbi:hypothetical protein N7449_002949 [Penicillium cf. viridicatum]|uniref:Uncharacterized protein n=1 Tax=Penicillium cf. viridicatum TaxID=2972119 RepID=A0A9W9MW11_9EURO|nr:hypothetical protein N7449_002949 [Penicillium cf. viridicatum]
MAARTLDRMRKAQSLLRECHDWLVENNEMLLAVEMCQIEGSLALLFEKRCFETSPCPGLQQEDLPRLVSTEYSMPDKFALNAEIMSPKAPFNGHRRRIRRGSYNGHRRAHPANRGGTEASTGRAGGGQNVRAQTTPSTSKGIVNKPTFPVANPKPPQARAAVIGVSPPRGVLLDFNDDVEFVQLPPRVVANMETAQTADLETKGNERLLEWFAACSSDQPAPGVEVRLDGDDKSFYQTIAHTAHTHTSQTYQPVNGTNENEKCDSKNCEETPVSTTIEGVTEGMLIDLDDDLAVIPPAGTDAGTDSAIHPEEKDVLAAGLDSGVEHNHQPEDLEDDEIVSQGNAAKILGRDFTALFVSSDDDSQTARRPIDLKAIFEKYSEVVICR